jgi:hypothetical protein
VRPHVRFPHRASMYHVSVDTTTTTATTTPAAPSEPPARPPPVLPDDAFCLGCRYTLHALTVHRCPECGREFDPGIRRTFNRPLRSRLIEWLSSPTSVGVRRALLVSCGMILWGAAWLPGAFLIEGTGWCLLVLAVIYGIARRIARRITRKRSGQPLLLRSPSEQYSRRQVLLVALAMSSPILHWPLRLNLLIHRPLLDRYAWNTFAQRPMIDPPATPRMVGGFVITANEAQTRGVVVHVFGGGTMFWSENGRYLGYGISWDDEPWYLRSIMETSCGPWTVWPVRRLEFVWWLRRWSR